MRTEVKICLIFVLLGILYFGCGGSKPIVDDIRYVIKDDVITVLNIDSLITEPPPDSLDILIQPQPIITKAPEYPEKGLDFKRSGTVWVKLWVTENGNVKVAKILKSDDNLLNRNTLIAAVQCRFSQAVLKNGKYTGTWISIPFRFINNR